MTSVTDLGATLATVLGDLGPDWLESRAGLLAALRETVPGETRAVHVLMAAFDAGVPGRLAAADGSASDAELAGETARVVDDFGSSPDHARAAVETWAAALGRMAVAVPSPAGKGSVQPLPAAPAVAVEPRPSPVQPLPRPDAAPPGVRPLPGPAPAAPPRSRSMGWTLALPAVALAAGGIWWFGWRKEPPIAPRPTASAGQTDEGYAIATPDSRSSFPAKRLDGDPNTILFTFGLRFGAETYTYQAAAAFAGTSRDGIGLVKAFKSGREASTPQLKVSRATQSNGYAGFTMAGLFADSPIAAPAICVSALAGRTGDAFDLRNGGGTFCAFGVTASGLCEADRRLGCGDLTP